MRTRFVIDCMPTLFPNFQKSNFILLLIKKLSIYINMCFNSTMPQNIYNNNVHLRTSCSVLLVRTATICRLLGYRCMPVVLYVRTSCVQC